MRNVLIGLGAVVLIAIVGGYAYMQSDHRLNSNWQLVKTGSLALTGDVGAQVFVDGKSRGAIGESGAITITKLLPEDHVILVSLEGHWPWTKVLTIESEKAASVFPFLTRSSPEAVVLTETDPRYTEAKQMLTRPTVPSPAAPLSSTDSTVDLYVRDNVLGVVWRGDQQQTPSYFCKEECGPIDVLHTTTSSIRNAAFYQNRSDVVIAAVTNGIFAIDIDASGTQNFQPLYLGSDPTFVPVDAHTLYIKDGTFYIAFTY